MTLTERLERMPEWEIFSLGLKGGSGYFFIGTKPELRRVSNIINKRVINKAGQSPRLPIQEREVVGEYEREADGRQRAIIISKDGSSISGNFWFREEMKNDTQLREALGKPG